jgi:hypothetical protein
MKNTLAENMLRFGVKNLQETDVKTIERLAEQEASDLLPLVKKLHPQLPKFIQEVKTTKQTTKITSDNYLFFNPEADIASGGGVYYVYKVNSIGGVPYIWERGSFNARGGDKFKGSVNDVLSLGFRKPEGDPSKWFPNTWNRELGLNIKNNVPELQAGAINLIASNAEYWKGEFLKFTRSKEHMQKDEKGWWRGNDASYGYKKTNFYTQFEGFIQPNTVAGKVYDIIKDQQLIDTINIKVKYGNNTAAINAIKYPEPVISQ